MIMMTRFLPLFLFCPALHAAVSITEVRPTVLFPNKEPLQQIAWVDVANSGTSSVACKAVVKVDGKAQGEAQKLEVPAGASTQDVLIPDLAKPAQVTVELTDDGGKVLASHEQAWKPQRKWIVYLVKSSHEDLGYEDYIYEKQRKIADNIDLARPLNGPKENPPDAPGEPSPRGYHYTLETLIFQRNYIDERSEAAWREIVEEDIKTGKMDLMGAPSGDHTQWMDYEELVRSNYPGRREAMDRFGLDLKTYLMVDNPSVSWSAAQAAANAGFKYILRLGQPWRTGGHNNYQDTKVPPIFWWQGPDGHSRILYAWYPFYGGNFWHGEPDGGGFDLSDLAKLNVNKELQKVDSGETWGDYPYDALIISSYEDHETPKWDNRAAKRWQTQYRYPEIRIAGINSFFEYMERKYGKEIPTLSGELNNFSSDYATIDPTSQGWKRQASRLLPVAEGTAAIASLLDPAYQAPGDAIERTYLRLYDYTEHSWPTSPPPIGHHLFNAQWVKHLEARRALDHAKALADGGLSALLSNVPTGKKTLAVFNSLAHSRTDLVKVDGEIPALLDSATGNAVPTQKVGSQTWFIAENVPAYGYKTFEFATAPAQDGASPLETGSDFIANDFYKITFDTKSGAVTSILDKKLNRELVDAEAKAQFNQMVWVHKNARDGKQGSTYSPTKGARLIASSGPVLAQMRVEIDDAKTGTAIAQTITIYPHLKRIDIVNDLQHARALNANDRKERYRENVYYAFPFDVKDFTPRVEYPGGVVRPYDDQMRWGSHDYLNANWWVDVSNSKYGVTLAPWNATTFNFGEIRYNQFSIDYKPTSPWLYSYAWSNRMSGLIELSPEEWNASLGYSLTSHEGNWDTGAATQFGWSVASPLIARELPAGQKGSLPAKEKSFLSVDAPNVQLTTLKQSTQPGRGWVARLVETDGKATKVTVDLSQFPVRGAALCDLVENDISPLSVKAGKVTLEMRPFSFATIRFFGEDMALPVPVGFLAKALSDQSIQIVWEPVKGAAAYLVYRSEDPAAPASAYTLVGRTTQPGYTDEGLKIDTRYYYQVAAVTAQNQQGILTGPVMARTAAKNTSAPHEVDELGVVRIGPTELTVYWQKSPDPDVARYYVYRSEKPGVSFTEPMATVPASQLFLQTYSDKNLKPATTYYYKVLAEDWAGNRQSASPETSATTPAATQNASQSSEPPHP